MSYFWLSFNLLATLATPITLGTNVTKVNDRASNQIQCIMQQQHQRYKLSYLPWRRAKHEVKQQRIDGYFTAVPDPEITQYASLSAPLFLENWYWFSRNNQDQPAPTKIRYGAVLGSHQADWFHANGYQLDVEVNTLAQLVQLLALQRIDMMLADQEDFVLMQASLKLPQQQFKRRFFRYVALGVYFSNNFLQRQPDFLTRFNQQVHQCASSPFALPENEQQKITALLLPAVTDLRQHDMLITAIQARNDLQQSIGFIQQHDELWVTEQDQQKSGLADTMLTSTLSKMLGQWQLNFAGIVTEVIVTDNQGANVAISAATSDYWQGDEAKFLSIFAQPRTFYLGPVEYDQSSRRFLTHLSMPVLHQQQHIGTIIVGINIEQALTERN
ncbi:MULTISPECIES: hypothetical protein [unclassified Arsukibacterium]|uniref:hypothetical protein n=1 Tax=unclassified Arsukibacterium TaxID=2635278 RepID=UPI000C3F125D|nr:MULTISPECIES: hypothetical protein [unclassified Arsukibacterium]MAA93089.1 cellulose-binding protein [Rheinheimera sp.]MBM35518.1 cellulose-binding protein [Rheinheimera sp.]HAW93569.1 cellulose-binding protein [Candidatus Azambacteria bacterium]